MEKDYKICDCGREFYCYYPMDVMCEQCTESDFIDEYDSVEFLKQFGIEPAILPY